MLIELFLQMNRSSTQNVNVLILERNVCLSVGQFSMYFFIYFEKLLTNIAITACSNIFSTANIYASCLSKLGSSKVQGVSEKLKSPLISLKRGQNLTLCNCQKM